MIEQGTGYMTTYSGKQFQHGAPSLDVVCIEDIAHHLSLLCHWGGACREFFSVAQHSVLVSRICPPDLARWGLMHDAAEAYCGDMIRPVKVRMPDYKQLETSVLAVIAEKFSMTWPEPPELKAWDNRVLAIESRDLMHSNEALHDGHGRLIRFDDLPTERLDTWGPLTSEREFLARFRELFT